MIFGMLSPEKLSHENLTSVEHVFWISQSKAATTDSWGGGQICRYWVIVIRNILIVLILPNFNSYIIDLTTLVSLS